MLITGATGGFGRALALQYASPGRALILQGRDQRRLAAIARDCTQRGAAVVTAVFDLTELDALPERLHRICGAAPIDLAITNAGVTHISGPDGESWEDISRVLDINVRAAIAAVCAVEPGMQERGRGQIALVSWLCRFSAWREHRRTGKQGRLEGVRRGASWLACLARHRPQRCAAGLRQDRDGRPIPDAQAVRRFARTSCAVDPPGIDARSGADRVPASGFMGRVVAVGAARHGFAAHRAHIRGTD